MPLDIDPMHAIHLVNGRFAQSSRADLEALFAARRRDDPAGDMPLVIHFHGGLVPAEKILASAETRLGPAYTAAGGYPIFFVWESGFTEQLQNDLADLLGDGLFRRLLERLIQFVDARGRQDEDERGTRLEVEGQPTVKRRVAQEMLTGRPAFDDPAPASVDPELSPEEIRQFEEILRSDRLVRNRLERIAAQVEAGAALDGGPSAGGAAHLAGDAAVDGRPSAEPAEAVALPSPEVLAEIQAEAAEVDASERAAGTLALGILGRVYMVRLLGALRAILRRQREGRDHGLVATAMEELIRALYTGQAAQRLWLRMKSDTAAAFGDHPQQGGTACIDLLAAGWAAGYRPRIVLVGHSAGAIYICHFLAELDRRLGGAAAVPELRCELVLLAPGCDFGLLTNTLTRLPHRIAAMRCFGMDDARESADTLRLKGLPVYPRSLLYLVSGALEAESDMPLVGMQRYYSDRSPYDGIPGINAVRRHFADQGVDTLWAAADGGPGRRTDANSHGQIDDEDAVTLGSLQHIIQQGF